MNFNRKILDIGDVESIINKIELFIKNQILYEFKKKGAVIGISGGIDSALVLDLAVNALGKENIFGVIMPERDSDPQSKFLAEVLVKKYDIPFEIFDITKILESYNIYEIRNSIIKNKFPKFNNLCKFGIKMSGNILENSHSFPYLEILDENNQTHKITISPSEYLSLTAATSIKMRVRMSILYFYGEKNNYSVLGTTNKTEWLQGYFVKYGDGGVDCEPIADLYKSQIYQLGKFLKLNKEVLEREPSPDSWSLGTSDKEFFFKLPYNILDLLLFANENKISIDIIKETLNLSKEQIVKSLDDIKKKSENSKNKRQMPSICKINL